MSYINEYANPPLEIFVAEYASDGRTPTLDDLQAFIDDQASVGWAVPRTSRGFTHHLRPRHDRTAIAHPWARLARGGMAQHMERRTRAQIRTGTFRVRLKPEDWQSGDINWLLDVIAPDRKATWQVIANAPRRW